MPTHTRRVIRTAVRINICVHAPIRSAGSLIRKTSFTSRSNRQRGGQASLTNMRDTGRWMMAEIEHVFRSAQNVWRLAPFHVRSERSPLHDVRQHAHANGAWTRRIACANSFSRTSLSGGRMACRAEARSNLPVSAVGLPTRSLRVASRAKSGGARRDRTDDLLLAKQALSQLSYGPALRHQRSGNGGPGKI